MDIKKAIAIVVEGQSLTTDQMISVMRQIMTGEATPAQIGGFLVALRMKGETLDEIAGAATVMRELASKVVLEEGHLIDTCGTGGDGADLFNVSTASAFVAAAAGARVAKHGNRSVSSKTGSADLLEAADIELGLNPEQVARCVDEVGVGFMFAPAHHSAMKHTIGPRRELGLRTLFNMLGPMTNPAGVTRQVIGVFDKSLCAPMAEVLGRLGSVHVLVVHSADGLDEFSLATSTYVAELKDGQVTEYSVAPEDVGINSASLEGLSVNSAEVSLSLIRDALGKQSTEEGKKAADIIALNAGAAIYVSGIADSFKEGVAMAEDAIGGGMAAAKLADLAAFTRVQVNS